MENQCTYDVWRSWGNGFGQMGQCDRGGKVEDGGKWYCTQHSPEATRKRNEKSQQQYAKEVSGRHVLDRRRELERAACAGIPDAGLAAGVFEKLVDALEFALVWAIGECDDDDCTSEKCPITRGRAVLKLARGEE